MKKRYCSIVCLMLFLLLSCFCVAPAFAVDLPETTTEVIRYEDGSYLTIELAVYDSIVARVTGTVSGRKVTSYRNSDNELLWDFTVHGTFKYDGTTATATDASYSYNIYNSAWKLKSAEAYCSGNQAIAEGKFNGGFLLNRSTSIGVLS